jgi:hypothetical protein
MTQMFLGFNNPEVTKHAHIALEKAKEAANLLGAHLLCSLLRGCI